MYNILVIALVLGSALDLYNNQDIVLAPGYNYNITHSLRVINNDFANDHLYAGVDSATSEYACIWCKCSSGETYDTTKSRLLTDTKCDRLWENPAYGTLCENQL